MTDPPASDPPMKLSAAQVSLVLKRAAEIDARGDSLSVGSLTSPSPGRIVAGGAIGLVCGFLFALSAETGIAAFGTMVIYVLLRAVQAMKRGSQLDFQLQNFTLWFGATLITGPALGEAALLIMLLCWIFTSIFGGLLVRFGPREEEPEEEVPQLAHGDD